MFFPSSSSLDSSQPVVAVVDWGNERTIHAEWSNRLQNAQRESDTQVSHVNAELRDNAENIDSIQRQMIDTVAEPGASSERRREDLARLRAEKLAAEEREKALREKLRSEERRSSTRLNWLKEKHREELEREREKFMRFVLRVEERDRLLLSQAASSMEEMTLRDVVTRLHRDFDVRLLAIDTGLTFLLDTPVERRVSVVEQQLEVRAVLAALLPESLRQSVRWSEAMLCGPEAQDVDLRVGQPLPEQVGLECVCVCVCVCVLSLIHI